MRLGILPLVGISLAVVLSTPSGAEDIWVKVANQDCELAVDQKLNENEAFTWSGPCIERKVSGEGTLEWIVNGRISGFYEGEMEDGRLDGQGVMRLEIEAGKGFDRLAGHFVGGYLEGAARYEAASGDYYEGDFKKGQRHGVGYYKMVTGEEYFGDFKDGQRHGIGFLINSNGDAYIGQFEKGLPSGQGVFEGADGEKYLGNFANSVPNGIGTLVTKEGDSYQGSFVEGKANGQFLVTKKDGSVTTESWKNGEKVK